MESENTVQRTNDKDAYVATVGGVHIQETATDLAVALATWSSLHEKPLPAKTVVIECEHLCMAMRGIRKPGATTTTSAVRGGFKSNAASRAEVMSLIRS